MAARGLHRVSQVSWQTRLDFDMEIKTPTLGFGFRVALPSVDRVLDWCQSVQILL